MREFLLNLALLAGLGVVMFIVAPEVMRQVFEIFNGLGLMAVIVILVVLKALPRKPRRRSR